MSIFCPTPVIALTESNSAATASSNMFIAISRTLTDIPVCIPAICMPVDVGVTPDMFMAITLSNGIMV